MELQNQDLDVTNMRDVLHEVSMQLSFLSGFIHRAVEVYDSEISLKRSNITLLRPDFLERTEGEANEK